MHNNVCIISVSCTLLFFGVIFVPCSQRKSVLCYYVSDHKAWADKIYRRFQSCRTDYNKISNRGKFGKSGQGQLKRLTALQKWKHKQYSFLAPFYKQGQKALKQSRTNVVLSGLPPSTDDESDKALDDSNESSPSNTRKDPPEKFGSSLTSPPPIRRTKKRTRDMDEKASGDQKAAHYGELMTVMKESASHLVRSSSGMHDREWESFFTWLSDFTTRMPRSNLATLPTENGLLGDGIYTSRVSTSKHSKVKNRELFFPGAPAAASHVPSPKTSRSSRHNLHRPFAGTAVPAVPRGSEQYLIKW